MPISRLCEFKEFAVKGNVVGMAVGITIGAAFGGLVVDPWGKGFTALSEAKKAGAPVVACGAFLNTIINFVILAFMIFLLVQGVNRLKRQQAAAPPAATPAPPAEETLLREIRDREIVRQATSRLLLAAREPVGV